jgi:hypothetical protein
LKIDEKQALLSHFALYCLVIFKFYMISVLAQRESHLLSLASSFPLDAACCCTLADFSIARPQ